MPVVIARRARGCSDLPVRVACANNAVVAMLYLYIKQFLVVLWRGSFRVGLKRSQSYSFFVWNETVNKTST
jgi:hypothetical protein